MLVAVVAVIRGLETLLHARHRAAAATGLVARVKRCITRWKSVAEDGGSGHRTTHSFRGARTAGAVVVGLAGAADDASASLYWIGGRCRAKLKAISIRAVRWRTWIGNPGGDVGVGVRANLGEIRVARRWRAHTRINLRDARTAAPSRACNGRQGHHRKRSQGRSLHSHNQISTKMPAAIPQAESFRSMDIVAPVWVNPPERPISAKGPRMNPIRGRIS